MTTGGVLRARKDGAGCSVCHASEENVGKKRCIHISGEADIAVTKERGMNIVNIDAAIENSETRFTMTASDKKIREYIKNLSEALSTEEKDSVLAALRSSTF